jgi:hypothetical protein
MDTPAQRQPFTRVVTGRAFEALLKLPLFIMSKAEWIALFVILAALSTAPPVVSQSISEGKESDRHAMATHIPQVA